MEVNFPRAVWILDFYHAAEHLSDFAKVYCGSDAATAEEMSEEWCHELKHRGGNALLATLEALNLRGRTDAIREAHRLMTGYVRNNLHRMDYPRYLEERWQIGSGHIEAACKTVINSRTRPGVLFMYAACFLILASTLPDQKRDALPAADLVVLNANVITVRKSAGRAEAFAVSRERFRAVGTRRDVERLIGKDTIVLDASGRTVVPGFIDAHAHPGPVYSDDSPFATAQLGPETVRSVEDLIAVLRR
jgi:hypothetical protein